MKNKKGTLYLHLAVAKLLTRATGGEKANTEHQIIVRQSLAYTQKPPSDKWHNERTTPNVRALSVSPLREQMRGNT